MKHLLLSLTERVLSRLPSAMLMVLLAAYVDPFAVGLYAWMILALTFSQSALDVPLRQISIEAVASADGVAFVRRIGRTGSVFASFGLLCVLVIIVLVRPGEALVRGIELLPLLFVPFATLSGLGFVARLQAAGGWAVLARSQAVAALAALLVTLPLLIATGSLAAAATQPLLAEGINTLLCRRQAKGLPIAHGHASQDELRRLRNEWRGAQAYSLLGWAQGQSDRVFVGAFAGATLLGSLSYAAALGRTGGDAATNAGVNVLRAQLRRDMSAGQVRSITESLTAKLVAVAVCGVIGVWVAATWILPLIVSPGWASALKAAPVIALSTVATAVAWHATAIVVLRGRTRQALPARVFGIALGLLVAIAAVHSLLFAALMIVAREVAIMLWLGALLRQDAPWRTIAGATAICVAGGILSLVLQ